MSMSVAVFFIMMVPGSKYGEDGMLLFSDCAVNPNPNYEQLAAIAIATADTARNLCKVEPRVAMLSFSTMGSAAHEMVDKVRKATELAKLAKELGHTSLGTSNHGNTNGLVQTYLACKENGIKPILGVEGYFLPKYKEQSRGYHLCT